MELILFLIFVMFLFVIYQKYFFKEKNNKLDWKDMLLVKMKLQLMTPREFEYFVAGIYSLMGYRAVVTPVTRDGGIDVEVYDREANMIAVECKLYDKEKCSFVSRPIAQKLVGACELAKKNKKRNVKGAIFTTSTFTSDCIQYCKEMGVEMYDTEKILEMIEKIDNNKVLIMAGITSSEIKKRTNTKENGLDYV